MSVKQQVEQYVVQLTNHPGLDPSVNLFKGGYLSSLDVLDLLVFVEDSFDISVSDDDLSIDNFGSINAIVDFVEKVRQPL